jgi:hypothetical protein
MTDVVLTKTVTGFLGSLMTLWNGNRLKAADDRRQLRRASADELWPALDRLQASVQRSNQDSNPVAVAASIEQFYAAWTYTQRACPPQWRHMKRSVRDSVGEALGGVVLVDFHTICEHTPVSYDRLWTQYAAEYLDMLRDRVSLWRGHYEERKAGKIEVPTYTEWLRTTQRWPIIDGDT